MKVRLLLILVALAPVASASADEFRCASANGAGPFVLEPHEFALVRTIGPVAWQYAAASVHLVVVDDHDDNAIPNPLNPNGTLFASFNRTTTTYDFSAVKIQWNGARDSVSIFQGDGLGHVNVTERLSIVPVPKQTVEKSHYASWTPVGAPELQYAIDVPETLRADAKMNAAISGNASFYSWDNTIEFHHSKGTLHLVTGQYTDMPTSQGSVRTRHFVHAFMDLRGVKAALAVSAGQLYAGSLQVESKGSLEFANFTGDFQTAQGPSTGTNAAVSASAGTFSLSPNGPGLQGHVVVAPTSAAGVQFAPDVGSATPAWLPATILGLLATTYLLPTLHGRRLNRREGTLGSGFKEARATAYASWAAAADIRGNRRLAAFLFGRAVKWSPQSPELHCEYGAALRRRGNVSAALRQHTEAAGLLARMPDPGCGAINAYEATLCAATLYRDDEAVRWLQDAAQLDPGILETAAKDPLLRRITRHVDYRAVTGGHA